MPDYAQEAANELRPYYDKIYGQARSKANDQGMLNSSIYSGMNKDIADSYAANLSKAVQARRDASQNLAAKLYELLYSGALGRATIAQSNNGIDYPTVPQWFYNTISTGQGLEPAKGSGPTGDAGETEGSRPGTTNYKFGFFQREQADVQNRQNQERIDIARAQLQLQREAAARAAAAQEQESAVDPSDMFQAAIDTGLKLLEGGEKSRGNLLLKLDALYPELGIADSVFGKVQNTKSPGGRVGTFFGWKPRGTGKASTAAGSGKASNWRRMWYGDQANSPTMGDWASSIFNWLGSPEGTKYEDPRGSGW